MRTTLRFAALCGVAGLTLISCGKDKPQLIDAPTGEVDDSPVKVLTNVDTFPNIAVKCYGVNGIYTTTRDGAAALHIVANDPQCGGDPQFTVISG